MLAVKSMLHDWAKRHGVSTAAAQELLDLLDPTRKPTFEGNAGSEAAVQADLRLAAARAGVALWRNNSGALPDENGRFVRFGLGNDSARISEVFKSSDLIGIWPQMITPAMVGSVVGRFVAVEVKEPGWKSPRNDLERAQANFLRTVVGMGGIGQFAQSVKDVFG